MYPKVITHLEISKKAAADLVRETNAMRVLDGGETTHLQLQDDPIGVLWNGDRIIWRNGWVLIPNNINRSGTTEQVRHYCYRCTATAAAAA